MPTDDRTSSHPNSRVESLDLILATHFGHLALQEQAREWGRLTPILRRCGGGRSD